ncbi:MAG: hypothetical protein GVY07_12610 [Bacteroidetes bacterium]|jgi:hypothetical protein|nr:hypothetical protein [Bacteroidota bacterium]
MQKGNIIGILILISLFCVSLAFAQQTQNEQDQSLLPEINPQDIEIRSQFQARFPGLRRQPILGFNPRPRVFQIDPNRMPFIEDEETVVANLPIGQLSRPDPPEYDLLDYATPKNAFIRAGVGSYITPEVDAFATAKLSESNWISTDIHFTSSDGHDQDVNTSYRFADATLKSFNRISDRTNLIIKAGAMSDFNHQLQLDTDVEEFLDTNTKITRLGFKGSADVDIASTSMSGTSVSASGFFDEYSTTSGLSAFVETATEAGGTFEAEYSRLGNHLYEIHSLNLKTEIGSTSPLFSDSYTWSVSTLSASYERLFNYKTDVQVSLGASGVTDAVNDFNVYFSPKAQIKHTLFRGLEINLEASAAPAYKTYSDIRSENRFFNVNSPIEHQYEMRALGELEMEPFVGTKIVGGASFQDIKNYLYYVRESEPVEIADINSGYYAAQFRDASILKIYGGFTQDLKADVLWFSADGYWQIPTLSNNDRIPYTETVGINAALSLRAKDNLLLEGWGEFAGGRKDHIGDSIDSYFLIGGRFELSLTDQFGVYGKLVNLLNDNYKLWQGFEERGFQGFVGLTFLF